MKKDHQKASKKVTLFFFQTQSLSIDKIIKNKGVLELVNSRYSGYKTSSEEFLYYLCITWPSLIMWFLSYSKNHICYFMQAHLRHKLFHFHLSLWIWEVWKGEKLQKLEYLENKKSFLDETKNIFHSFWRAIVWWKNKNLIKNSRHKL